jgi:hypothetical protein
VRRAEQFVAACGLSDAFARPSRAGGAGPAAQPLHTA